VSDYYATLGLPRNATFDEVRHAWHAAARRYHPDAGPDSAAATSFGEVRDAYATLASPIDRMRYDATLPPEPEVHPSEPFGTALALVERARPAAPPAAGSIWRGVLAAEAYAARPRPTAMFVDVLAY
jgi:curved DNA-binding protein CbpA